MCFPLLEAASAVLSIYRFSYGERSPLETTLRAGALCMIQEPKETRIEENENRDGPETRTKVTRFPLRLEVDQDSYEN